MPWETPPVMPYGTTPGSYARPEPNPPIEPLTVSFDLKLFEEYLPAPRTDFLSENPESSTSSPSPQLPHVTLTYAQSMDGQISLSPGIQTILSGPETKAMTHYLRTRHDAIMIGAGTAVADNPGLNSRYAIFDDSSAIIGLHRQPRPFILDASRKWQPSPDQKVFQLAEQGLGRAPWWIVMKDEESSNEMDEENFKKLQTIGDFGGEVLETERYKDWGEILGLLGARGVRSVMIEGGGSIIASLLEKGNQKYVSSVVVTVAPTWLGKGGVGISPSRTGEGNEAMLKDVCWVPMGHDVVMAARLESESNKD